MLSQKKHLLYIQSICILEIPIKEILEMHNSCDFCDFSIANKLARYSSQNQAILMIPENEDTTRIMFMPRIFKI